MVQGVCPISSAPSDVYPFIRTSFINKSIHSSLTTCCATLVVNLPGLNLTWPGSPAEDFMYQFKGTCYFTNGTQRVRLMARQIYNKEEILSFDSDVGVFVAVTKLRQSSAKSCNAQKDLLAEYQAHVDTLCRHNYYQTAFFTVQLRVTNFYPQQVKVRWFWNKEEETSGVVSTPLIQNGDWTYKILVMLEVTPQPGDVYTCHLEHPSLQSPITVEWWALSESAQNKMLSGIGSFVPGLIFLGLGLVTGSRTKCFCCNFSYHSKKGEPK
uniref:HLA class II histocompatibility antigen, DQ beta 1 chain-like n=1 Tax=Marmota marmota marmota TaxID=9994 RepID=A0A8C6A2D7_MARMA